jgi:hypothetical protein
MKAISTSRIGIPAQYKKEIAYGSRLTSRGGMWDLRSIYMGFYPTKFRRQKHIQTVEHFLRNSYHGKIPFSQTLRLRVYKYSYIERLNCIYIGEFKREVHVNSLITCFSS